MKGKIRIGATPALAATLLMMLAFAVQAQGQADLAQLKQERLAQEQAEAARLAQFARGAAILSSGQRYVLLTEVRAVSMQSRQENPAQRLEALGIQSGETLETKGRFLIFKAPTVAVPGPMLAGVNQETSYPVVLNERTGRFGVVLGSIVARLEDIAQAEAVAADHGLRLGAAFAHLGVASFEVPPGEDIFVAGEALAADPRVRRADLEILENPQIPQ